jgi:hypothetical protein
MPVYIRTDWEGTQKVFPFVCFFRPLVEGKTQNRQWNQQNHYKVYIVGGGGDDISWCWEYSHGPTKVQ